MSLKKSRGNMYDWVTHTHSHLAGECRHFCSYCYVGRSRFGRPERYAGEIRLIESELKVNYGKGRTIFIEHMNDLFGPGVQDGDIMAIVSHCRRYPDNTYVLQTKNPKRAYDWVADKLFPFDFIIGTTVETNRSTVDISHAPEPWSRVNGISFIRQLPPGVRTFITVEPILDFDPDILVAWIVQANPEFVNIGADSKGCGLVEPTYEKVMAFISLLNKAGVTIRKKVNLNRLFEKETP